MDQKSEHCKDVYAYFGLAIYSAQCLEQAMIHLITFLDHFPKTAPHFSTREKWTEDYDRFFLNESGRTMGQLLGHLQKVGMPHSKLEPKLKEALTKRNWLAHSYFSERAMDFMSEEGRNKMIEELNNTNEMFMAVDSEVSAIYYKLASKYGLTEEVINIQMAEMLVEAKSDL